MKRKWCIWCESGDIPSSGYYWIHLHCAEELMDMAQDVKEIKEMLHGIHPRNNTEENKINVIFDYIMDMESFRTRLKRLK